MVCLVISSASLLGCSGKQDNSKQYKDTTEALEDYKSCLSLLSSKKDVDTKTLITLTRDWKSLDKALSTQFFSQAFSKDAGQEDSVYLQTREAILDALDDAVDSRKRSLSDYLDVVTALNERPHETMTDSLIQSVHHFYASMDATPTYGVGNAATVVRYEQVLTEALTQGIHTKQEVFTFLRAEDKAFRSFLEHLPTLGNISLTTVRDNSSLVLKQIVDLADEQHAVFTPTEAVTILTMRNNRRLIQNARQCVGDIQSGKVGKDEQAPAFLWMLLQPWITFDSYAFSLMSEEQLQTMRQLAKDTPGCITKLGNPDFPIDTNDLPALLIKTFIHMQ